MVILRGTAGVPEMMYSGCWRAAGTGGKQTFRQEIAHIDPRTIFAAVVA